MEVPCAFDPAAFCARALFCPVDPAACSLVSVLLFDDCSFIESLGIWQCKFFNFIFLQRLHCSRSFPFHKTLESVYLHYPLFDCDCLELTDPFWNSCQLNNIGSFNSQSFTISSLDFLCQCLIILCTQILYTLYYIYTQAFHSLVLIKWYYIFKKFQFQLFIVDI